MQDTTKRWTIKRGNWSEFFVYVHKDQTRAARKGHNNLTASRLVVTAHCVWDLIDPGVSIHGHGSALKTGSRLHASFCYDNRKADKPKIKSIVFWWQSYSFD